MNLVLYAQLAILAVITAASTVFCGISGFWSALAGGLSYVLPSATAILLLTCFKSHPQRYGKIFLLAEGLKVILALVLLLTIFWIWHETLEFLPFIIGLFSVSHLVVLAFLRIENYGK